MPRILEYASSVIDLVADELEVSRELILSKSRTAEVVDARHLAIKLLHSKDIYPSRIAAIFRMSPRSVRHVITAFAAYWDANIYFHYLFCLIRLLHIL